VVFLFFCFKSIDLGAFVKFVTVDHVP